MVRQYKAWRHRWASIYVSVSLKAIHIYTNLKWYPIYRYRDFLCVKIDIVLNNLIPISFKALWDAMQKIWAGKKCNKMKVFNKICIYCQLNVQRSMFTHLLLYVITNYKDQNTEQFQDLQRYR